MKQLKDEKQKFLKNANIIDIDIQQKKRKKIQTEVNYIIQLSNKMRNN